MYIEKNLMVPMEDGIRLATDVYRPEAEGRYPVLVARTPYDKSGMAAGVAPYAEAGYIVVVQDVRGRFASEGDFLPYAHEADDGNSLMTWIFSRNWCDGNIGTFGGSYLGGTQWLLAKNDPPGLKTMIPEITFDDLYAGCMYQGGAKVLHDLRWTVASIIPEGARRACEAGGAADPDLPEVETALHEIPLATHPAFEKYGAYYRQWLAHYVMSEYWARHSPNAAYQSVMVPALHISGWYDIFVPSTLKNYAGMKERGGSEQARRHQRLIMGPWTHMNFSGEFPEISYGEASSDAAVGLTQIKIDWFDRWLKAEGKQASDALPVKIFVMGANTWRDEADWPLPDTQYRSLYLHSKGSANTLHGDGWLSEEKPGDEPSDSYVYDPMNPCPTMGGQVILPGENAMGPRDQREAEERGDVLVYSTPAFETPVEVTGSVQLKLFVSSDCLDTDFTAKISDVFPDGRSMLLSDGILRARYRESFETLRLLKPGEICELTIEIGATSNLFLSGHHLRLDISSSNFPKYNRNSNTGGEIARETAEKYKTALNRVFHDAERTSRLILPVINR